MTRFILPVSALPSAAASTSRWSIPSGTSRARITVEIVESLGTAGEYIILGAVLPTRVPLSLQSGDSVYVLWENDKPFMILDLESRKGPGADEIFDTGDVVEELFIGTQTNPKTGETVQDVFFRNATVFRHNLLGTTPIVDPLGRPLSNVKWGADRKSFVVRAGTTQADSGYHVFKFKQKKADSALLNGGTLKATAQQLDEPTQNTMTLLTITADRQTVTTSIGARWLMYLTEGQVISYANDPATNTKFGATAVSIEERLSTKAIEHQLLTRAVTLKDALAGTVPGLTVLVLDYYLDKDGNVLLGLRLTFNGGLRANGTITREGILPRYPTHEEYVVEQCSLLTESANVDAPDLTPLGPTQATFADPDTAKKMSPFLAEHHFFLVNITKGTVVFKTTRDNPELRDETANPMPAMEPIQIGFDPISRWQQIRKHVNHTTTLLRIFHQIPGGGGGPFGEVVSPDVGSEYINTCGFGFGYGFVDENATYAEGEAAVDEYIAFWSFPFPSGVTKHFDKIAFNLDEQWVEGRNASGLRTATTDLWNRGLPWVDANNMDLPVPEINNASTFVHGLMATMGTYIYGHPGTVAGLVVSDRGMDSRTQISLNKWTITAYKTRPGAPVSYRIQDARVLSLGTKGQIWFVLERVQASGTAETPVWNKDIAIYVTDMAGALVSIPLPWTAVGVISSGAVPTNYVPDEFFDAGTVPLSRFWHDGTQIEVLYGDSDRHVLWTMSTLAERTGNPKSGHIKLTYVPSGLTKDVGTDVVKFNAPILKSLGLDLLYQASESLKKPAAQTDPPPGRRFVLGWDFTTGEPLLDEASTTKDGVLDFPKPDPVLSTLGRLQDLPKNVTVVLDAYGALAAHYHVVNDKGLLPRTRFRANPTDPYPVS